jgi:hypothetical protein
MQRASRGTVEGRGLLALGATLLVGAGACDSSSSPSLAVSDAAADAAEAPAQCGTSLETIAACVQEGRLGHDVTFIAQPRLPGSPHWQAVQNLCAARFERYGFEVELHKYETGVNVLGKRRGVEKPDEQVVISAHYDHIANCPGADDNATGVAAVLETARVLQHASLQRTLILACWDEEERGLLGAMAYAARAKESGDNIIAMTSLEMIGYKDDTPNSQKIPMGFDLLFAPQYQALVDNQLRADFVSLIALDSAAELSKAFETRAHDNALPTSLISLTPSLAANPLLSDLSRSDHAAFWLQGFPALQVTDTSNFRYAQYHCRNGDDVPGLLSIEFLTRITRTSVAAHLDILGLRPE